MARKYNIEFTRTYVSEANAEKAVEKLLGKDHAIGVSHLSYSIWPVVVEGKIRYGVLFYGERAVQAGIHFHFNCVN